jgi:hypothetical protein
MITNNDIRISERKHLQPLSGIHLKALMETTKTHHGSWPSISIQNLGASQTKFPTSEPNRSVNASADTLLHNLLLSCLTLCHLQILIGVLLIWRSFSVTAVASLPYSSGMLTKKLVANFLDTKYIQNEPYLTSRIMKWQPSACKHASHLLQMFQKHGVLS